MEIALRLNSSLPFCPNRLVTSADTVNVWFNVVRDEKEAVWTMSVTAFALTSVLLAAQLIKLVFAPAIISTRHAIVNALMDTLAIVSALGLTMNANALAIPPLAQLVVELAILVYAMETVLVRCAIAAVTLTLALQAVVWLENSVHAMVQAPVRTASVSVIHRSARTLTAPLGIMALALRSPTMAPPAIALVIRILVQPKRLSGGTAWCLCG